MTDEKNTESAPFAEPVHTTEIGEKIVISFHGQFAKNQNHHQNLFIQVLAVLLSVLVGLGYLYIRLDAESEEFKITVATLNVFLPLATCLLSMAAALICAMAYGFRRDQLVSVNIRMMAKVMNTGYRHDYFLDSFNPARNKSVTKWMPEFHKIFFISLLATKILLLFVVLSYPMNLLKIDAITWIEIVISVESIPIDIYIFRWYHCKWKGYVEDPNLPARLK